MLQLVTSCWNPFPSFECSSLRVAWTDSDSDQFMPNLFKHKPSPSFTSLPYSDKERPSRSMLQWRLCSIQILCRPMQIVPSIPCPDAKNTASWLYYSPRTRTSLFVQPWNTRQCNEKTWTSEEPLFQIAQAHNLSRFHMLIVGQSPEWESEFVAKAKILLVIARWVEADLWLEEIWQTRGKSQH